MLVVTPGQRTHFLQKKVATLVFTEPIRLIIIMGEVLRSSKEKEWGEGENGGWGENKTGVSALVLLLEHGAEKRCNQIRYMS